MISPNTFWLVQYFALNDPTSFSTKQFSFMQVQALAQEPTWDRDELKEGLSDAAACFLIQNCCFSDLSKLNKQKREGQENSSDCSRSKQIDELLMN